MKAVNKLIKCTRQGKWNWGRYSYDKTKYGINNWVISNCNGYLKLTYKNIVIDVPTEDKLKLLDAIE